MRDPTGQLAQRAQPLLLPDDSLRLAQVLIGVLQRAVKLRLMSGQRDEPAQLSQKLTTAAAECTGLTPGAHYESKSLPFNNQRRKHDRAQPASGQAPRKGKRHSLQIGLIDELAAQGPPQPVLIDTDLDLLLETQLPRRLRTHAPQAGHGQQTRRGVEKQSTSKIDRHVLLQAAQNDLKDTAQVLALTDRPRRLTQQLQPLELRAQPLLHLLALGYVGRNTKDRVRVPRRIAQRRFDSNIDMRPVRLGHDLLLGQGSLELRDLHIHSTEQIRHLQRIELMIRPPENRSPAALENPLIATVDQQISAREILYKDDGLRVVHNRLQQVLTIPRSRVRRRGRALARGR